MWGQHKDTHVSGWLLDNPCRRWLGFFCSSWISVWWVALRLLGGISSGAWNNCPKVQG